MNTLDDCENRKLVSGLPTMRCQVRIQCKRLWVGEMPVSEKIRRKPGKAGRAFRSPTTWKVRRCVLDSHAVEGRLNKATG